jgi:hypothetical protein
MTGALGLGFGRTFDAPSPAAHAPRWCEKGERSCRGHRSSPCWRGRSTRCRRPTRAPGGCVRAEVRRLALPGLPSAARRLPAVSGRPAASPLLPGHRQDLPGRACRRRGGRRRPGDRNVRSAMRDAVNAATTGTRSASLAAAGAAHPAVQAIVQVPRVATAARRCIVHHRRRRGGRRVLLVLYQPISSTAASSALPTRKTASSTDLDSARSSPLAWVP